MIARTLRFLLPLALLVAVGAPSAQPAFPGPAGRIAYVVGDDVYSAAEDGSDAFNLTNHAAVDQSPAWSPSGDRIVFASFRGDDARQALFVMNNDGTNVTRVSPGHVGPSDDATPSWAPDGQHLAFASTRPFGASWGIWIVRDDGANLQRVADGVDPAFSPDGTQIAYVAPDEAIHVMNWDGSNDRRLTQSGTPEGQPSWSPDGNAVVFGRYESSWRETNERALWVVHADGTGERRLTADGWHDANPSWAPDGTRIVFQRHPGVDFSQRALFVVPADGSGVAVALGHGGEPDWGVATAPPPPPPPPADTTPPHIVVSIAVGDRPFVQDSMPPALYQCSDDVELSSCTASVKWFGGEIAVAPGDPLPTSEVGQFTFHVVARDAAGNTATDTRVYRVVYAFNGFFKPLEPFPNAAEFRAGDGVPVRFSLNGDRGRDVLMFQPHERQVACGSGAGPAFSGTTGSLSYNASLDRYTFLWQTAKTWSGTCRQLELTLRDGTRHHANVSLR